MAEARPILVLGSAPVPWTAWLKDLRQHGPVLLALARKDFQTRYKRASFGVLWAVALPVIQAVVMAIVFSRIIRFDTGGSYTVFVMSGLFAWTYFSATVQSATTALVDGSSLADKVWFPRATLALVPVLANAVGLVISIVILVVLLPMLSTWPGWSVLLLVPATVLLFALTTGLSLACSALHVYYRDTKFLVTAVLVVALYLTPVIYPADVLGEWAGWLDLNPITGVVELFHSGALGSPIQWRSLTVSLAMIVVVLIASAAGHRRHDRLFIDLL
jgi:lipopolysaccharide transport system permease protein